MADVVEGKVVAGLLGSVSHAAFDGGMIPLVARRIREHWSTEKQQHYILDVTFSEDASRIRKGTAPEISSAFRRLSLGILKQDTTIKDSIRGKRIRCGWDNSALQALIANFSTC